MMNPLQWYGVDNAPGRRLLLIDFVLTDRVTAIIIDLFICLYHYRLVSRIYQ